MAARARGRAPRASFFALLVAALFVDALCDASRIASSLVLQGGKRVEISDAPPQGVDAGAAPNAPTNAASGALGAALGGGDSAQIDRSRRGFHSDVLQVVDEEEGGMLCSRSFCVQQVQGAGDCLFHSIAIAMAFEDEKRHLDMYDPSLDQRVSDLRALAVKTLTEDPSRTLHLEGDQAIVASELISAAAEQYGITPEAYCKSMSRAGVWGGGPEILAIVNALERPIHVFEPIAACNGTEFRLQLCGAFGSPRFDNSSSPVCIIAADDRFPDCKPTEVKRHGEGGNHFLALLPARGLVTGTRSEEPESDAKGSKD